MKDRVFATVDPDTGVVHKVTVGSSVVPRGGDIELTDDENVMSIMTPQGQRAWKRCPNRKCLVRKPEARLRISRGILKADGKDTVEVSVEVSEEHDGSPVKVRVNSQVCEVVPGGEPLRISSEVAQRLSVRLDDDRVSGPTSARVIFARGGDGGAKP